MASILRQIVAGPRAKHPEAGLDLCYVTDNIIATSGPSGTYPQLAYRNPLSQLVAFLDKKHGDNWAIWEFRAEGTGYPDEEVYGRVKHYPWPDHHPPPFALIPLIMASMRNWLTENKERVAVVHCKAGKGRSGSMSCSYLISEEGWTAEDAIRRFTERRMRPGFGAGVSIPSQLRWISYVDRWTQHKKVYVEREIQILEVHVWGLRDGVKVSVEGFVDEGRVIKNFHTFTKKEREIVRGEIKKSGGFADAVTAVMGISSAEKNLQLKEAENLEKEEKAKATKGTVTNDRLHNATGDVVFRPSQPVILPTSDVNIDFERRNKAGYGMSMVTAVAHVWFNCFFEGQGPENASSNQPPASSGVFEIDWEAMDGIKGSLKKGTKGFDKLAVVWKAVDEPARGRRTSVVIVEPPPGAEVPESGAADWRGHAYNNPSPGQGRNLGLRSETPASRDVSQASSMREDEEGIGSDTEGVQSYVDGGVKGHDQVAHEKEAQVQKKEGPLPLSRNLPGPEHKFADA
ncbi:phosphatases II [Aureobasidium sp. EXF-8846]|jgi:protein-tyrosine phosphatase|nr:phosphatases II [Aureobasidium sp. EXF-8846]